MGNINNEKINIFGLQIDKVDYGLLLSKIYIAVTQNAKLVIGYANAHILNEIYKNSVIKDKLSSFDITHPDGIGAYIASRLLYGKYGFAQRMTGSDFYPFLIKEAVKRDWSIYFFGHDAYTLNIIKEANPELNIAGCSEGFNYESDKVVYNINKSQAKILVAGLGFPLQEKWIFSNKDKIKCNIILAVGDGIKVFANTKKRGPAVMRKIGLEWLVRLFGNPKKYWKRYLIGNPVFLYRIIVTKLCKFTGM